MAMDGPKFWCRAISHWQTVDQTLILQLPPDSHSLPLHVPACHLQSTISFHRFTGGTNNSAMLSPVALSIPILVCLVRFYEHALRPYAIPSPFIHLVKLQDGGRQF